MPNKKGRPARRTQAMTLRVSPETKASYQAAAYREGMSTGDFFELEQIEMEQMRGHIRTLTAETEELKDVAEQVVIV